MDPRLVTYALETKYCNLFNLSKLNEMVVSRHLKPFRYRGKPFKVRLEETIVGLRSLQAWPDGGLPGTFFGLSFSYICNAENDVFFQEPIL